MVLIVLIIELVKYCLIFLDSVLKRIVTKCNNKILINNRNFLNYFKVNSDRKTSKKAFDFQNLFGRFHINC